MEKFLTEMPINKPCKVAKINTTNKEILTRFLNFGVVCGEYVKILYKAPKDKNFLIAVRGYALALDKDATQKVIVYDE